MRVHLSHDILVFLTMYCICGVEVKDTVEGYKDCLYRSRLRFLSTYACKVCIVFLTFFSKIRFFLTVLGMSSTDRNLQDIEQSVRFTQVPF